MALSTSPRSGDTVGISELQIISIGTSYGLQANHPAVTSLIARSDKPSEHEIHERLNPNSLTNSRWENGVLHVFTSFDRVFGGLSPVSVSDTLLPPNWTEAWRGIVVESKTVAFLDRDGSEIVCFHGAGGGNRILATNAELPIRYYCSLATPRADLCSILITLDHVLDHPRPSRRGLNYNTVSFRREDDEWVHGFC